MGDEKSCLNCGNARTGGTCAYCANQACGDAQRFWVPKGDDFEDVRAVSEMARCEREALRDRVAELEGEVGRLTGELTGCKEAYQQRCDDYDRVRKSWADERVELEGEVEREAEHRRQAVSRVMKQEQAALARAAAAEKERDEAGDEIEGWRFMAATFLKHAQNLGAILRDIINDPHCAVRYDLRDEAARSLSGAAEANIPAIRDSGTCMMENAALAAAYRCGIGIVASSVSKANAERDAAVLRVTAAEAREAGLRVELRRVYDISREALTENAPAKGKEAETTPPFDLYLTANGHEYKRTGKTLPLYLYRLDSGPEGFMIQWRCARCGEVAVTHNGAYADETREWLETASGPCMGDATAPEKGTWGNDTRGAVEDAIDASKEGGKWDAPAPEKGGDPDARPVYSEIRLRESVNDRCSCGGMGPNDPGVCPACMIWHDLHGHCCGECLAQDGKAQP